MVEVEDSGRSGGRDQKLRERVARLSRELDELESLHRKASKAFQGAFTAVAGISSPDIPPQAQTALKKLKKEMGKRSVEPEKLGKAVSGLKTSLMTPRKKAGRGVEVLDEKTARAEGGGGAGRHVAMALLSSLHMGDAGFDARLEKGIAEIYRHIAKGEIRPAMKVVAELMASFQQAHDQRRKAAETALNEVLTELMHTEEELAQAFSKARQSLSLAGEQYEQSVTSSVGRLAKEIKEAKDINTLKTNVLDHIRALRDGIRDRRAQERELLANTQNELKNVRRTLTDTRQQMQQVEKQSEEYSQAALTDPMTKVWNKRALSQRLEELLSQPRTEPFSLIFFDIDYFKHINDTFGHQAGDRALKAIAEHTNNTLRQKDTLYRYAGDEFVIVLAENNLDSAKDVAERVRRAAENIKFTYRGEQGLMITVSLGVSQAREVDTPEELLERADQALLEAKRAGRNRVITA